jgi:tetratricopeptide (TPR) repeat protein
MLCNVSRLNEAQPYLEKALTLAEMHQEEYGELINAELYAMGKLKLLQEEFEAAEGYLLRCLKLEESVGDPDDIKITKDKLIELYHSWGRSEMAEVYRD